MRVKTQYLVEGCIISKDVPGLTSRPIMNAKTILTQDLLEVLKAFLVPEVSVERTLINGLRFVPKDVIDFETEEVEEKASFITAYLKTVQEYKRLFKNWQAGSPVDVSKVREIMIPLFETAMQRPSDLFTLRHYCEKEDYLFHHAITVGLLSGYIAAKMNFDLGDILQIVLAGSLVDCGMARISPSILEKKAGLTSDEFNEVKKHPIFGLQMLQNTTLLKETVKLAILQHHERLDGSGYPSGKRAQSPHIFSRIVAVADVYNAMCSERHYRKKQSPFKVLEMIRQDNFGKFDITVVQTLLAGVTNFSIGSRVILSNGYTAEIVFVESNSPTRPMVKVEDTGEIINLEKKRDIFIEDIV
ncbi:HD-GYP domain-containing protein [Peribacillus sp. SCS-155]|uniref:HD-GYP domain-containing protein n=1 Tax=Peribacillus sedimenti TaxID=3115297 RepID=UPI003906581B